MSSRPILAPYKVIDNQSMASIITSKPTIVSNISMIAYEVTWAGTAPMGTISVQVSNSYAVNDQGGVAVNVNVVWTTLPLSASTAVSGNSGTGFIQIPNLSAHAIRLVYTPTSGTGTLNAIVSGKVT